MLRVVYLKQIHISNFRLLFGENLKQEFEQHMKHNSLLRIQEETGQIHSSKSTTKLHNILFPKIPNICSIYAVYISKVKCFLL